MDLLDEDELNELPFRDEVEDDDDDDDEYDILNEDDDNDDDDDDLNEDDDDDFFEDDDDDFFEDDDDNDDDYEDDDYNDDADIAFRITNSLYKNLGRSRISVVREHYTDLLCITRTRKDKDAYSTPLHVAVAKSKHIQSVEYYLKGTEIDKDCRNRYGETALLLAISENVDETIINMLFEYGCDVSIGSAKGISPLHVAVLDNKVGLIRRLIGKGADVNKVSNVGVTPLHLAVLASHYEAVCELLNHNASPTQPTILEFTPLMLALGFRDIDIRISETLCTYGINTTTRIGNPIYCAVKAQHCYLHKLIVEGADVNYVGSIHGRKTSCILEAASLTDKHLFQLIWTRVDQDIFKENLMDFLVYFADNCGLRGSDLVECLSKVLTSPHSAALIRSYYTKRKSTFLQSFFDNINYYQLTNDNCCEIISALPIIFYEDVSYIYKKFNFNRELETLLKSYECMWPWKNINRISYIYIDYICYNKIKTNMYNLKEIAHFLKFSTPDPAFRTQFFDTFSALLSSSDTKLSKLIALYNHCRKVLVNRSVASLQELSRDKLREILFLSNKKPYKAMSDISMPEIIKDILYLKVPIYF